MTQLAPPRGYARKVRQAGPLPTYQHHTAVNTFVKSNILNADSAQHAVVCRYHVHDQGNICFFGSECHYLHFAHLDRPKVGVHQPFKDSQATLVQMKHEIDKLHEGMTAILHLIQNTQPLSSAAAPPVPATHSVSEDGDESKKDDLESSAELEPIDPAMKRLHAILAAARNKNKAAAPSSSPSTHPAKVQTTSADAVLRCFARKAPTNANKGTGPLHTSMNQLIHNRYDVYSARQEQEPQEVDQDQDEQAQEPLEEVD